MRNLIAFYLRFRIFLVFAALQGVALYTYFTSSEFPKLQLLTTTGAFNAEVLKVRNDVTKHFNLENTNKQLEWENIRLREKLRQSVYRVEKGAISIDDTSFKQQYTYIPGTVINSTFDKRDNYMTIDVGQISGIERGMGVFSSRGVVGVIHYVGTDYSIVKTVLTKNINIDVMLEKGGAFGLLKWNGEDARRGTISGISNDMVVKKWSKVVTRGGSGIFPRGILVGKVEKKGFIEGKPLWDITVRFSEDFRSIQHVYVVKNLMMQELIDVEKHIPAPVEEEDL